MLRRLGSSAFEAYVDVSKAGPGVQDFQVRVDHSDPRVRVDEVLPSKMTMLLEVVARKEVPVKVSIVGSVPFGYTSKPVRMTPEQVVVSGPQSVVTRVASGAVEVNLEGVRTSIGQPFRATAHAEDGTDVKSVTIQPGSVFIELPVEREVGFKTVPLTPRVLGTVALGYQIVGMSVEPTAVTVVGDPVVLGELTYLSTKPVNVGGATGDVALVVEAETPEGVSLARKQNLVARVFVSPVEGSQVIRVAPTILGQASDLQSSVSPGSVDVTLSGPMPSLSSARPQDVKVVADVSGLVTGTYTIVPTVTVPSALRVDSVAPNRVSVTIR